MYDNLNSNDKSSTQILLLEDEIDLANLLILNLNAMQYQVIHCTTILQAKQQLTQHAFDLVLLDRMLPDGDGISLCQQLEQLEQSPATMLITAKDNEADVVLGLESGADDYLIKPFGILELRARINALLRRNRKQQHHDNSLQFNALNINIQTREVCIDQQPLELTATEFDLLHYLAKHPHQVFSRMQLLEAVWGYSYQGYEHTVNSHINRLRAKLAQHKSMRQVVKTVWGVGYKFVPDKALLAS